MVCLYQQWCIANIYSMKISVIRLRDGTRDETSWISKKIRDKTSWKNPTSLIKKTACMFWSCLQMFLLPSDHSQGSQRRRVQLEQVRLVRGGVTGLVHIAARQQEHRLLVVNVRTDSGTESGNVVEVGIFFTSKVAFLTSLSRNLVHFLLTWPKVINS